MRDQLPLPAAPDSRERELPSLEIGFSDVALFEGVWLPLSTRRRPWIFKQELAVELGYGKAIHHVLPPSGSGLACPQRRAGPGRASYPDRRRLLTCHSPTKPTYAPVHQAANRLVSNYVDRYASDLRRIWAVEHPFELHLADGRVSGRADIILDEETGRTGSLAIVDYKVAAGQARGGQLSTPASGLHCCRPRRGAQR